MRNILRLLLVIMLLGSTVGVAFGATITFDKTIDVPDRDFTVNYEGSNFNFTIDNLGNYKFGDSIVITINGGLNDMRLVIFNTEKPTPLTPWFQTFFGTGGVILTTIPADRFDPSCLGVCNDNKMGPGIYALAVQDRVNGPPYNYITAKPFIISEYDLAVTPEKNQVKPGDKINVTVKIFKSGSLVDVADNVKVELVQDSTSTHFGGYATKLSTGTYEINIQIPATASGTHLLYAAITTAKTIYQDYPEIMGADSGGSILITNSASTQTTTSPGGGGGGGGGLSGEDFSNIEVKEKYELNILNNKITSYMFKNTSNLINFINITGNISAGPTTTSVEVLKDTSSLVKIPAPGLVYKNMNIWVGTSGFAVPKNIKSALIVFKVDNSWINNNGLSSSDVKLVKWDGNMWIELETTQIEKNDAYTIFEGKTTSFSPFAISATVPEITPVKIQQGTQSGTTQATPKETTATQAESKPPAASSSTNILVVIGIVMAVGIAVRLKNKEK